MAMQIRLTMTADQIAAERKRAASSDSMVLREDARNMGAITATRVGGRRPSKVYSRASACISYYADDKSDAIIFSEAPKNRRVRAAKNFPSNIPAHRITAADLRPIFAD